MLKNKKDFENLKCTYCGQSGHTSFTCFQKPKRPFRQESKKHKEKRIATSTLWYKNNPPDKDGFWICYLQISEFCPIKLTNSDVTLEHVYPKVKYPELVHEILNLKSACGFCNKLKLSNTLNQLKWFYPKIAIMVSKPEWQEWEDQMENLAEHLDLKLDRPRVGR